MREIYKLLELINKYYSYPSIKVLQTASGPEVIIENKKIIMLGSYNYLGLANNNEVKQKAIEFLEKFGVGTGGVRLLTGTMVIHEEMEKLVADFTGHEDCITIGSGFGTNAGVIPGVINLLGFGKMVFARKAVIFSDEYNHASIIDGCRLSEAKVVIYKHNDVDDLENKIKKYKRYRKLIITDGVFSMDGDICHLDKIIDIAKKYEALTMVDDAHSFGVLGKTGSGTAEYFNRKGEVDINMGTFSKGIGVSGGFVSCKKYIADYLRLACRTYMFSDAISPVIVGGIIGSITYIKNHPQLLNKLKENSDYFRQNLQNLRFNTLNSATQIVPLLIGNENKTIEFYKELFNYGVFAPMVMWPAVPKNTARIRFSIMANHTKEQLDKALNIILNLGKKFKII